MAKYKYRRFKVNTVNAAAEQMLGFLEERARGNVIYFEGWDGFAASATLRVVAQRLKSSKLYDKVIHVDCSVWKNMRAVQKIVAKELDLPQSVMAIFHQRDEDDDFHGIDQGSRGELEDVWREIFKSLANGRFAVIFHNGSDKYVNLSKCGIPMYGHLSYKLLWTFQGRFRSKGEIIHKYEELMGNTIYCTYCTPMDNKDDRTLWGLVHEEAEEVVEYTGKPEYIDHKIVEECILYMWALRDMDGIDWETHASNYWVCDGIVQDKAWEIGDALQSYIHLDWDWRYMGDAVPFSTTDHLQPRQQPISKTTSVPPEATSFFLPAADELHTVHTILPDGMFQHSDSKLRVLHLSCCTFNFASPPFLCCSNLRFLLLDHCINTTEEDQHQNHRDSGSWRACFGNLWVLDLSYTNWYWLLSEEMMNLMVELRELNVKGVKNWRVSDLHGGGSLIKLRVTTNPILMEDDDMDNRAPFLDLSHAIDLKTIILDGCVELEQVVPEGLAPLLESFSFVNNDVTTAKISSISFRGHAHFKSLLLRGLLGNLSELDLSDTMVKTLDLSSVQAQNLKRVILLGCEKLRAILWPPKDKMPRVLEVLRIDTTQPVSSVVAAATAKLGSGGATTSFDFNGYISVRDARLLRSLVPFFDYSKRSYVQIEIDSSPNCCVVDSGSKGDQRIKSLQQPAHHLYARDVLAVLEDHLHASAANEGAVSWMWACPPMPATNEDSHRNWYVHIQDDLMKNQIQWQQQQQQGSTGVLLEQHVIYHCAMVLHVHDSSSIIGFPCFQWYYLEWCRVERCPKLGSVFTTLDIADSELHINIFRDLRTFWASELLEARYIWNCRRITKPPFDSFTKLRLLHLDYCLRLIHVLPLAMTTGTLNYLETLEIVCCGDLREVFPLHHKRRQMQKTIVEFPKLKRIHLHELPMLQCICEHGISTPKLEMIKIRGCWSLNRLPAVGDKTEEPKVKVDCEKEWWDGLEWDGVEANHHPSLYKLSHCPYYKKADLPRGTLLR